MALTHRLTDSARPGGSKRTLAAIVLVGAVHIASVGAQGADLVVRFDQSQLLRLPRPVAEVIVGNPGIADVTVQGGNLLVVTGKSFGVTNIIALDGERNIIQDQRVLVERDERSVINLRKGVLQQTFSCTPDCAPMLNVGDDPEFFRRINEHNAMKAKSAEGSSEQERN